MSWTFNYTHTLIIPIHRYELIDIDFCSLHIMSYEYLNNNMNELYCKLKVQNILFLYPYIL